MKFSPIQEILKNGESVTIREATRKDAGALITAVGTYLSTSPHLITTVEEFNPTSRSEARWIEGMARESNSLLLVALHRKTIIGNLTLKGEARKKIRHNATLGVGIIPEWRGQGLGRLLIESAVQWARDSSVLENLWLQVFSGHTQGIELYEKLGFEKTGVQQKYVLYKGEYTDSITMRLALNL